MAIASITAVCNHIKDTKIHQITTGVIQPVNAPFWDRHRPGDRWNCQCSLQQTDEEPTDIPSAPIGDTSNSPSPGLDNNPGKDGILFNDHHPYFPQSCASCPFAATGKKLFALVGGRKKNCYECVKIDRNISTEKNKNRDIYNELLKNPDYYNVKYDEVSGGVYGIHKGHNFDSIIGVLGIQRGDYEKNIADVLFKKGHIIIFQNEQKPMGTKSYDATVDGVNSEIKGIEKQGKYTVKNALEKANKQEARTVLLYFHDITIYSSEYIKDQWEKFIQFTHNEIVIDNIICVSQTSIIDIYEIKKSGLSKLE